MYHMGAKMSDSRLVSLADAAETLEISVALINKFIRLGFVKTVKNGQFKMLTPYGIRRLSRVVDLYEKSYPTAYIEAELNH